jgi:hypothetical protein
MPPTFRPGDCSHIWAESDHIELNAAVDYWCEGDPRCRLAKEQAILSACEKGLIGWTRADGKTFNDPLRELATRQLLLIERKTFETWAAAVDEKIALPPSLSTRETNSLRRQLGALALLLTEQSPGFRKADGTPPINAIAEAVVALLGRLDMQRLARGLPRISAAGVSNSSLRQQIAEGLKELES